MNFKLVILVYFFVLLSGCASISTNVSTKPYWENQQWVNALGHEIQANIGYPINVIKKLTVSTDFPSGTATVQFTYDNGSLKFIKIVHASGNKDLDRVLVREIASIKPQRAPGIYANNPHRFQYTFHIEPLQLQFFRKIHDVLDSHALYPRSAVESGEQGSVVVQFVYRNGMLMDPLVAKSSGYHDLDQSVIYELGHVFVPRAPKWLGSRALQLSESFCFTMGEIYCGPSIFSVRYEAVSNVLMSPAKEACSKVAFDYRSGKITDIRLAHSSGDKALDKKGLQDVAQGHFPTPTKYQRQHFSNFEISVCPKS